MIKNESELIEWLKVKVPDIEVAKDKYSVWDCYSKELNCRIELKCRRTHYNSLLIEKKKYDSIIEKCKNLEIPIYLNSTPKGIYGWNLLNQSIDWEVNTINPSTTDFKNNKKVKKEVGYLNLNTAKQYERF